jgi:cytochrome c-type biogenesis protein CcmH
MILFWLICLVLIVIALAFILPPLMQESKTAPTSESRAEANIAVYRDQISELEADLRNGIIASDQFQQDRDDLEKRLLEDVESTKTTLKSSRRKGPLVADRSTLYTLAIGIPILAVAMYLQVGNRSAIGQSATQGSQMAMSPPGDPQLSEQQRIQANVDALAKKLEQNPTDFNGWLMLANSYTSLERYDDAVNAYAKATGLKPDDADLWANYAFVLAMKNGRKLAGEPTQLLNKALQLDPENPRALQLSGSAAFEAKNYQRAIFYWEKLQKKAGPETELGQAVGQRIAEAKRLAAQK